MKKCCKINKFDIFALLPENAHVKKTKVCFVQQKSRNKTTARRCSHRFAPCTNKKIKLQRKSHFALVSVCNVSCVSPCCLKTPTLKEAKVCFVQQKSRNKTTARRRFHRFAPCTNKKSNCNEKATLFLCKQLECLLCFALLPENAHVKKTKVCFVQQKSRNKTTARRCFHRFAPCTNKKIKLQRKSHFCFSKRFCNDKLESFT